MYQPDIITIMSRQRKTLQISIEAFKILQKAAQNTDKRYWLGSGIS